MYKLISPIDNGRWSFLDGYHIFKNVVWLMNKSEIRKYKLINEDGNEVKIDLNTCLEKE